MEISKIAKAFEAYALFIWGAAKELAKKPNMKKHFGRRVEIEEPQGADNIQINIFGSKKPNAKAMKCFNCRGSGHGAKNAASQKMSV